MRQSIFKFQCYSFNPNPTDGRLIVSVKCELLPDERLFDDAILQIEIRDVLYKLL